MIRSLAAAGAKFDAVNKENLTPLLLAEKPEPPPPPGNNTDARAWRPTRNSREEVIAALRELMNLGPNDPAPVPPPKPVDPKAKASDKSAGDDSASDGDESADDDSKKEEKPASNDQKPVSKPQNVENPQGAQ